MTWYHKGGNPLDVMTANELLGNNEYRRVGLTKVASADGTVVHTVSTIWLGLDHRHGDGSPVIFETMVFGEDGSAEQYSQRYSTELEASIGHAEMVALVAATVPDEVITDLAFWPTEGGAS